MGLFLFSNDLIKYVFTGLIVLFAAEDPNSGVTFHTEEYALQKVKVLKGERDKIEFIIPSHGSHEILIHVRSDRFLHSTALVSVHLRGNPPIFNIHVDIIQRSFINPSQLDQVGDLFFSVNQLIDRAIN